MQHSLMSMVLIFVFGSAVFGYSEVAQANRLPRGYRSWMHTKSMVITDKSSGLYGFHNIYANKAAMVVQKKGGGVYPKGAAFVVSFYDAVQEGSNISQGKKLMDVAMIKAPKMKKTNGWAYAAFDAKGKAKSINPLKDCHSCHLPKKKSDYVQHNWIP